MRTIVLKIIIVLFGFLMFSFMEPTSVNPEAYISAFSQNKSNFRKYFSDTKLKYTLSLIPKELKLISQYKKGILDQQAVNKLLSTKSNEIDFILELELPENGNQAFLKFQSDSLDYEGRLKYYAFSFLKDIKVLNENKDEISISAFNFERNFGASPKATFTFSIAPNKRDKKITLQINDQVYGQSMAHFEFNIKQLRSLPRLKNATKW